MIAITGAVLVLPDRQVDEGSILVEGDRITAIETRPIDPPPAAKHLDARGAVVVAGFIDVHVHGVEGVDVLDGRGAVQRVAQRLPRYGVTAFCPTSIACPPDNLEVLLEDIRNDPPESASLVQARVLPAHLESNFINPDYKGAQPLACIRTLRPSDRIEGSFSGADILAAIARHRARVGIVTLAPEIDGGLELVSSLVAAGHRVSIGHSGATYEQALAAIDAGATHATHLFNRMSPLHHRAPGVPGAVLESEQVAAELICDGFHVHPSLMRLALRAKGLSGILAITDGTAGSGLPVGSRATLGGRPIIVTGRTAELEDGTLAGSVLTMDGAFRMLVNELGLTLSEASRVCSATPAEQLRLRDLGRLETGASADLVLLDRETLRVQTTIVAGRIWNPVPSAAV
jgi:N-acetylglucosamine-6-phosphate deacetylase